MLGAHPSMTEARAWPVGVPSTTPGRPCGFEGVSHVTSKPLSPSRRGGGRVGGGVKTGNPQRIVGILGVALPLFPYILGGGAPSLARSWVWWSKPPSKEYPSDTQAGQKETGRRGRNGFQKVVAVTFL